MLFGALFPKGKTMSHDPQSAPDIVFLRNIGIALVALTVAAGTISVVEGLKTSEPVLLAQSMDVNAVTVSSILK